MLEERASLLLKWTLLSGKYWSASRLYLIWVCLSLFLLSYISPDSFLCLKVVLYIMVHADIFALMTSESHGNKQPTGSPSGLNNIEKSSSEEKKKKCQDNMSYKSREFRRLKLHKNQSKQIKISSTWKLFIYYRGYLAMCVKWSHWWSDTNL